MSCAIVDYLGVTFKSDTTDTGVMLAFVTDLVRCWFGQEHELTDTGRGWSGYRCRYDIEGVGLAAFGGNGNTVHLEITGQGCAQVKNWKDVASTVDDFGGKITRCDVACDDFDGARYSIDWCKGQYHSGGFDPTHGARPKAKLYDDLGTGDGSTFYVGSRESGKLFRGYEKGKEQGHKDSKWFRVEVEYRAVHRSVPLQIIENPGPYLAGAYKCLTDCDVEQQPIKTFAYSAAASFGKAVAHAKLQAGRALHAVLMLNGGDINAALAKIHRPELPKRLAGYIKAVLSAREAANPDHVAKRPALFNFPYSHPTDIRVLQQVQRIPDKWWEIDFQPGAC
jgi:phage replication initiation protein